MTNITRLLAEPMLKDYVSLTNSQIEQTEANNLRTKKQLRVNLQILALNEEIEKN
jgi:hypothetical protein